ncbi:MAG: UUP1 family membrane protein, partial [Verrucomicrobiales bacterium]
MKKIFSLGGLVFFLLLVAGAGIYYKNQVLGVPLWPDEERGRWLLEARISLTASNEPTKVVLALPGEGWKSGVEGQPVSMDYGYSEEQEGGRKVGVWSGRELSGQQLFYYRVVIGENEGRLVFPRGKDEEVPVVNGAGATGARETALAAVESHCRLRSADEETFVRRLQELVAADGEEEAYGFLRRYYGDKFPDSWQTELVMDVMRQGGIPCQPVTGILLSEERGMQEPLELLEYYDRAEDVWRVFSPAGESLERTLVWSRGQSLLEVFGGKNSRISFSAIKE